MKVYPLFIALFLTASLTIQCSNLPEGGIPEVVESAFKAKYPKAKNVSWEKDSHGYFEAKFEIRNQKYRADFSADGSWVETEANIKFKDLPEAVQDAVEREYDKDDIVEIEQVDSATKGIFYDVEIDEKGKKKIDIEYDALGRIIGTEGK